MNQDPREPDEPDESASEHQQAAEAARTPKEGRQQDPDAPGNFVDDQESEEIPEPNEPA